MNLLLRFIRVMIHAFFRSTIDLSKESVVVFRVFPHDIDLNIHMTNSRYLSLMDLGRVDLMLRSPLAKPVITGQWKAVLGSVTLQFRRPLKLFQKISLHTRVIGWDQKWIYLEQKTISNHQLMSTAIAKCLFLDHYGIIVTERLLKLFGSESTFPAMNITPVIQHWNALEETFKTAKNQGSDQNEPS